MPAARLAAAEASLVEARQEVERLRAEMKQRAQDAATESNSRVSRVSLFGTSARPGGAGAFLMLTAQMTAQITSADKVRLQH